MIGLDSQTKRVSLLVSRYLMASILPYFFSAWALLTVVLFVQQASRYADIFFGVNIPGNLVWQLAVALLPNVIAFTCPMAVLVGTIIGLTKMQGDSELVAIRASGVGNMQIALPIVILGLLLSGFAFLVNSRGVPIAASLVRSVAIQTALKKLESPIQPGVFNTEVAGYTIYVRSGDIETGRWQNIFIYNEDRAKNAARLITSHSGRIDATDQASELVLENASVTTLPLIPGEGKYVTESLGDIRLAIKTPRADLVKRLTSTQLAPEELGLAELSEYAAAADRTPRERAEAQILQQRRILLSITPLIFCLLGTVIVLRINRGGRGFGIALALSVLVLYYFLAFAGEQLARTNYISVWLGGVIPLVGSAAAFLWFNFSSRSDGLLRIGDSIARAFTRIKEKPRKLRTRDVFVDLTTGLRDFDIIRNLVTNFLLTVVFLIVIFQIFTAFEMWKFAGVVEGGVWMLAQYLLYLSPSTFLQVAPAAAMIAILATYVIKSRQNEIVTWTSAGQSVYRLLIPCFLLAMLLGVFNWILQESILPSSNVTQDAIRMQIRNKGVPPDAVPRLWIADGDRIYSYRNPASDNDKPQAPVGDTNTSASDNEKQRVPSCLGCLADLSVYQFGTEGKLQSVYRGERAVWEDGKLRFIAPVERDELVDGRIVTTAQPGGEFVESVDPFVANRDNPAHIDTSGLKKQLAAAASDAEQRDLAVSIQLKYSTAILPLVIALFTAPFSLSLDRKGKAATVGYAVGLWLVFTSVEKVFEQLGINGYLAPGLAVWTPLVVFAFLGIYLLSRVRT
ncbi:MAG TPA: LptF/LptG family permease [Pyrinomonadaceae bacterium]|nr:LptF/LptG family permease [Pyrinomonadaceae bacterium]